MNPKRAVEFLNRAIALHAAHMDGSEPTNEASQERLMSLLEGARIALVGEKEVYPPARRV